MNTEILCMDCNEKYTLTTKTTYTKTIKCKKCNSNNILINDKPLLEIKDLKVIPFELSKEVLDDDDYKEDSFNVEKAMSEENRELYLNSISNANLLNIYYNKDDIVGDDVIDIEEEIKKRNLTIKSKRLTADITEIEKEVLKEVGLEKDLEEEIKKKIPKKLSKIFSPKSIAKSIATKDIEILNISLKMNDLPLLTDDEKEMLLCDWELLSDSIVERIKISKNLDLYLGILFIILSHITIISSRIIQPKEKEKKKDVEK